MSALQTIIRKGCINDVQETEDGQFLLIELSYCELTSLEIETLASIGLDQQPLGSDVFACLYREGVVSKVGRSSTGNWCAVIVKSLISEEELTELEEYTMNNMPIGNTTENRERVTSKLPPLFQKNS